MSSKEYLNLFSEHRPLFALHKGPHFLFQHHAKNKAYIFMAYTTSGHQSDIFLPP